MIRFFTAALLTGLLAGCASTPMPPPVTAYSAANCPAMPDLGRAISLTPAKPKKAFTVTVPVGRASSCITRAGAQAPYVLFALPAAGDGKMIEVGAQMEALRIFSPSIALLDGNGRQVRGFTPNQYLYRGALYSVQFVPREEERFVLVAANPALIGSQYDAVAISTSTTHLYGGMTWTRGIDENVSRTFSYEGGVTAIVHDPAAAQGS